VRVGSCLHNYYVAVVMANISAILAIKFEGIEQHMGSLSTNIKALEESLATKNAKLENINNNFVKAA